MGFFDWFKPSPTPSRPVGAPEVLAKQEEVVQALSQLPQFRELKPRGLVDLVRGTLVTASTWPSEPPYLLLTFSPSNQVLLSSVAALDRYLALQRAVAHQLGGGDASSHAPDRERMP